MSEKAQEKQFVRGLVVSVGYIPHKPEQRTLASGETGRPLGGATVRK